MANLYRNACYDNLNNHAPNLPTSQHDVQRAKMFLQKYSFASGDNLYNHISELLSKILMERPKNALDNFEIYSCRIKEQKLSNQLDHQEIYSSFTDHEETKKLIQLFQVLQKENLKEGNGHDKNNKYNHDNLINTSIPHLLDLVYFLEYVDVGLPKSEAILLNLSIQKLIQEKPITNARFWGKILGISKNYYIVEAKLDDEEIAQRLKNLENDQNQDILSQNSQEMENINDANSANEYDFTNNVDENMEGTETKTKFMNFNLPPLPKYDSVPAPIIPNEAIGTGLNTLVYYVCNSPGLDNWIELQYVSPQQIISARQIIWYFTGYLTSQVQSFPNFLGNESDYLRAQIARISAATLVSPTGFFTLTQHPENESVDESEYDEEELDDKENERKILLNPDYEPLPMKTLKDQSLLNWCHQHPYILPHGRISQMDSANYVAENEKSATDEESSEEEKENSKDENISADHLKETVPPLLTPLENDTVQGWTPVWSIRLSSKMQLDTTISTVRSNVWSGAVAFTRKKEFGNIYTGTGHKHDTYNYHPPLIYSIQNQYMIGPEIMECQDLTNEKE